MKHVTSNMHAKSVTKQIAVEKPVEPLKVSKSSRGEHCHEQSKSIETFVSILNLTFIYSAVTQVSLSLTSTLDLLT